LDEKVTELGFKLRQGSDNGDITIKYDAVRELLVSDFTNCKLDTFNEIRTMKMELPENRQISLRILLDRVIVESFGNNGEAAISSIFKRSNSCTGMEFYTLGGNVQIRNLSVFEMKSIWIDD
jgi:fructan beta-fructosidase